MPEADQIGNLVASAFSIVKDATVTGLLFWFARMLITGQIVRKDELDQANERTKTAEGNAKYWEGKFHEERETVKEQVGSLRETITALMLDREPRSGRR